MAAWIKMPLGMEVGTQLPPPSKEDGAHSPIFGPCLLWPNGWMDQDGS